jgi:hypothetical protein
VRGREAAKLATQVRVALQKIVPEAERPSHAPASML